MTLQKGEKISVCLLTYNHVNVIESTLRSILEQTITGYEIIVSDDCSTDGTWERIIELAEIEQCIKPIQTPRNMGMPGNANFAVAKSSRPYVALLHHDDLYRCDLLEKWIELIEQYSDIAFVFNSYGVYENNFIYTENIASGRIDGLRLLENYLFPRWGCAVRGTAMIRRSAWEQVGGMREQFSLLADIDLWMRFSMCWAVGYVSEPVISVRRVRPEYYPDIYDGEWSWKRQRFLYEIHAVNRKQFYDIKMPLGLWKWWQFRIRLSLETAKWLTYAIIKRKWYIIEMCEDSKTQYDQVWLTIYRQLIRFAARPFNSHNLGS